MGEKGRKAWGAIGHREPWVRGDGRAIGVRGMRGL